MVIVVAALSVAWGLVVLVAGIWSLWADWTFERRERLAEVIPFPSRERDVA